MMRRGVVALLLVGLLVPGALTFAAGDEGHAKARQEIPLDRSKRAIHLWGRTYQDQGTLVIVWAPWLVPVPNRGMISLKDAAINPKRSTIKGFDGTSKEFCRVNRQGNAIQFHTSGYSSLELHLDVKGSAEVLIAVESTVGKGIYRYKITEHGLVAVSSREDDKRRRSRR
ncbi:hypothetical protein Pan216_43260 [Planctomycetes bacterium Pan216]|uniref:DUF4251 domain-containing protein n=1 Tax=Kolteria novifilia TaxID=2527975 RepID=A0A518B8Y9_9BACT|nr:hypothetical protein Pan216_43260 [Planctomycetes bacterium Pan216]